MATTHEASSDMGNTSKRESERRSWTPEENKALLATMKKLVVNGWKSNNGFRPGFANKLAEAMQKKFPNRNIKASPHINSKLTTWKRAYASIRAALSRSGVGYNLNGDHKIDCDQPQLDEIIKLDSYARNIKDKSFPLLDGWKEVFGKDRAAGDGAADIMEFVNKIISDHEASQSQSKQKPPTADHEEFIPTQGGDDSVCESAHKKVTSKGNTKKRKIEDGMNLFCELVSVMHTDTDARLKSLAERIGYQVDLGQKRKEVFSLLENIPNLSLADQFVAGYILVKEPERLEYFTGLPERARPAYLDHILHFNK